MTSSANLEAGAGPDGMRHGGGGTLGRRLAAWAQRVGLERKLALVLLVATVTSGTVTFAAMTGNLQTAVDPRAILLLLVVDLVLLLALSTLIVRRLVILWTAHKRGLAGAQLHTRLVLLFSLVAVTPSIVVATFSVILFDFGLQAWFSDRVRTALEQSIAVAEAYLEEHRQNIAADALAIAQDLDREGMSLALNPERFNALLEAQAGVRSLTEVMVFDSEGRVLGRAGFSLLLDFDPQIPDWAMRRAAGGEVVILTAETDDRVRALYKLDSFGDTYLYVGRLIDARVLQHSDRTQDAVQLYERLEGKRSDLTITFALIFVVVAMMLLLAAVWVGLALATRLTRPIGSLVEAAERVRAGDLGARVDSQDGPDEIGTLSQAFNRMTEELQKKQAEILNANVELDHRSRFIEAVLGGVSAGVIGLDKNGIVTLPNRSACELLETTSDTLRGRKLSEVVPEMAELVETARRRPRRLSEKTIALSQGDGGERRLLVRVTAEADARKVIGYVVTFDDVTELLSAQRKAAWADVARRIAHEIKNPLTPIQLSAERLKRKYRDEIKNDPETFETCTDIIVRHVGDIGRMVDEFSAFARMPAPRLEPTDLTELVRQSAFLQQGAHPDITIAVVQPDQPIVADCDPEHVGRALTNLLQNAVDALEGRTGGEGAALSPGQIAVRLYETDEQVVVEIEDNGPGLPKAERHRLTEPYVTTRLEGTGLGLAIVKKIMEDHGGRLILEDAPEGGARVKLEFPAPERTRRDTETAREPLKAGSLAHGT